jgi:HSP20 family protein
MTPFQMMRHFSDEMDRIWGDYGRGREESLGWRPSVDVREQNGQLQVRADLPGVKQSDIKVAIENDALVIQGERKREEERHDEGWYRSERSYGSFYRSIPLPEGVETDKANARFENGVLEISIPLPKAQHQQQKRQIPISGGSLQTGQQTTQPSSEKTSRAGGS